MREHHAPFVTAVAAEILTDLRTDVDRRPETRVLFLGRDGHSYAAAVRGLDPQFYESACGEIVISRAVVDAALQDLERNAGATFPDVEPFRSRGRVHPSEVDGAYRALTGYLAAAGMPVASPDGGAVTLVDNSFKGTIQEMLAAAYPDVEFTGRYALHGAHPADPHPGTKHGYAFHQEAGDRWRGYPEDILPPEPELTFGSGDAVSVLEDVLHGPDTSPRAVTAAGPTQHPQSQVNAPLRGLNPVLVAEDYRDPIVREAIKTAALVAVHDTAVAAGQRWSDMDPAAVSDERGAARDSFTTQVRAWITRGSTRAQSAETDAAVDPHLGELLDSFVARADKADLIELHDAFVDAAIGERAAEPVWQQLARNTTLEDTRALVTEAVTALQQPELPRTEPATSVELRGADRGEPPLQDLVRDWRRRRAADDEILNRISEQHGLSPDVARTEPPRARLRYPN